MIVDSASEVLKIPESDIEAAPAMMQEGGLDCVTGLGKYQGRLIILLDIDKVLAVREAANQAEERAAAASAASGSKTQVKAGAGSSRASAGK